MQVAAVIVLAAVLFIAANYYASRFGLLWWVAHTLVFALVLAFVWLLVSMLFAPFVAAGIYRGAISQPE